MRPNHNESLTPQLKEKLSKIKHVALDMDGTIYLGSTLFPFTKAFLAKMSDNGIGYSFLTNNPSKSVADYLKKLEGLGIEADEENMYTTSLAAIDYIKAHYPQARRLFLLGTPSMISQFEKAGFESCTDSPDDVPDVLVVAFDMTLEYSRLCRAAWWASQGVPYIATNPDRVCPTDQKVVLVDCGSICKCIEHATGRQPDITLGRLIRICSRAYSTGMASPRMRLPWSVTVYTPILRWHTMPEPSVSWCSRVKRPWRRQKRWPRMPATTRHRSSSLLISS